jgi:TPR repeat protein
LEKRLAFLEFLKHHEFTQTNACIYSRALAEQENWLDQYRNQLLNLFPYANRQVKKKMASVIYQVGLAYTTGLGVQVDEVKASQSMQYAAERGEAQAQLSIAHMYYHGKGTDVNLAQAFHWAKLAAEQNNAEAQCLVGDLYRKGEGTDRNENKGLSYLKSAAEQGDDLARLKIGKLYLYVGKQGHGIKMWQAFHYTKLAAEARNSDAQFLLGWAYLNGRGTAKDEKLAFYYIELAAKQGNQYAQFFLGKLYLNGQGTTKNEKLAFDHLTLAAEKGVNEARELLGHLYLSGLGADKNEALAFYNIRLAAEQMKSDMLHLFLGLLYLNGLGTSINEDKAFQHIKQAADQHNLFACIQLAYLLDKQGKSEAAIKYIKYAAQSPIEAIQYQVANFYWDKSARTPEEETYAKNLYLQLANKGDAKSMSKLILCYIELGESEEAEPWLMFLERSSHQLAQDLCNVINDIKSLGENDKILQEKLSQLNQKIDVELTNASKLTVVVPNEDNQVASQETLTLPLTSNISQQLPLVRNRPNRLTNAKLLRQLAKQAGYAEAKQEAITTSRNNKETLRLQQKNAEIAEKISRATNVKLTLGDFIRLFNDPVFCNRVEIKSTDSGFIVKTTLPGQTETISASTHWPHEGESFNRSFLRTLSREIIEQFVAL